MPQLTPVNILFLAGLDPGFSLNFYLPMRQSTPCNYSTPRMSTLHCVSTVLLPHIVRFLAEVTTPWNVGVMEGS